MTELGFVGFGHVIGTGRWDGSFLCDSHKLSRDQRTIPRLKDSFLQVAMTVTIAQFISPVAVLGVSSGAKLLFLFLFYDGI